MLSGQDISASLSGAWRLMRGKADGLRLLDLSADGFWNSFFAIVVALPAMAVGWVGVAGEIGDPDAVVSRLSIVLRLAVVDLGTWVLPLCGLAFVGRRVGIGDRFVHYVVASNWASAIVAWIMLPAALVRLVAPASDQFAVLLSLALFLLTMVFTWRMTNAAVGKGAAIATAVFVGMFVGSLAVLFALQALLGITVAE
ncbi:transporter [Mesorhizobium sp. 8]|uniref:transporter n=1 Tax=Mesorhizobium sp. 8 TaxID=2584466 RepID=UPI00111CA834|nr:transporter [Mesorhizobium sp. 8]QDC02580.1 transporter [Mesorhizobium sp. 8]